MSRVGVANTKQKRMFNWFKYSSPATFYPLAGRLIPLFWVLTLALVAYGLYLSFAAPTDYKQGEGYRIIFVHVPASWMSMFTYLVMAFWSVLGLTLNTRLSAMMTQALAPTGALMAFLSLWTGAFWGKPMWGTWWEWDARITSELILLFLYLGYLALIGAIDDRRRADRAGAILILVGVVNLPIIYFSVEWWNTLHQGATIKMGGESSMDETMKTAMFIMGLGFWTYTIAVALGRVRNIILQREHSAQWVRETIGERA